MTAGREEGPAGRGFITGLGIGQICSWGSLYYSFPLIAEAMRGDLGWSKVELYGAATVGLALGGLATYPVGAAIDRGHGRLVMALGSVLAGLLLIVWARTSDILVFYGATAGIGLLQAATLYEPAFAVVVGRAGAAEARAGITVVTLWGGFASTVFIPLIQFLLDRIGWRDTLVVLAGINLIVCAGLYGFLIDRRKDVQPATAHGEPSRIGRSIVAEMIRQPVFWALATAFTAYTISFSAFTFHLYPLLLDGGFDSASVVAVIAVIGPAQVAGRVAIWLFAPRLSVRRIGSIVMLVFPISLLGIEVLSPDFLLVAASAAFYGAANGIITIVRGMAVPEMLTREGYGAVNGLLSAPATIARALGPVGAAVVLDAGGGYDAVLVAVIAGATVMTLSFWLAAWLSRDRDRR